MHNFQEMVQRQARSWQDGNIDAFVADFAPDGLFISPGGHWQGHTQIRAVATAFFAEMADGSSEDRRYACFWRSSSRRGGMGVAGVA